jgi:hypothetical protein
MERCSRSRSRVVRWFASGALAGLLGVGLVVFAGCMSRHAAKEVGQTVITKAVGLPMDLMISVGAFRHANSRWPKDQAELTAFIERSNGEYKPISFDRVEFTEKPDGSLGIYAAAPHITCRGTLNVDEAGTK